MSVPSRVVVCVVAVLVVTSVAAGVTATGATENEHVEVEQRGATLNVAVDQSAFGVNDTANATIAVEVAGREVESGEAPSSTRGGTNQYAVDLSNAGGLRDRDLSSANVTVSPEDGDDETVENLDLRYVALANASASFADGELVLPVSTAIGVPGGIEIELAGSAGSESGNLTASLGAGGEELTVASDDAFATLALAGDSLTVQSKGALDFEGGTYDVRAAPSGLSASVEDANLEVEHPLLFADREYTVTITTQRDGADVVTTRTGSAGDGALTVEHGGTVGERSTVEVQHGDVSLGTAEVDAEGATTASLSADGRNVTEVDRLGGSGETNVTVFGSEQVKQYGHLTSVPYRNGTVLLGDAGYELENGSYVLVLEPNDGDAFTARLDAGGGEAAGVNALSAGSGSILSDADLGTAFGAPVTWLLVGGVIVFLAIIMFAALLFRGSGDRSGATGSVQMMDVDVRVVDGMTGELVDKSAKVQFEPAERRATNGPSPELVRGEDSVRIPQKSYRASFVSDQFQQTAEVTPTDAQVELSVPPREERITVEAAGTGTAIPDATVELTFPDGSSDSRPTGNDGVASFKVPYSADESECELSVEHDRHRSPTVNGLTGTVSLEPLTGGARVDAQLDGEAVPGVDVVIEPDDEYTRRVADPKRGTADDSGTVTFDALPVGQYVAHLDFVGSATVETTPVSVDVAADEQAGASIDATFSFRLDGGQRERIDDLHRDIADLTPSNRDGAVPYYYGSVLSSVLETVDQFPDEGVVFVRHGVDPDAVTDATIAAVDGAVEYTRTAMTSKQNVDLFSACRGLREARVKWDGEVSVADLVAFLGDEKANHRREMIDRLEAVDDVLDDEQDEVSTVTPARSQFEQVREQATGLQDLSPVEQRAHFFVGLRMLDAVESVFDEPVLVDRLEETVF